MRTAALLSVLVALLLLPSATAHATVKSDDGQWWITVGNLNEPATTWMKTGLDLIIREVGPDDTRIEAAAELGAHNTLVATVIAPQGQEMDCALQLQHGAKNRYTCDRPYYLTQPGQYKLRLEGTIGGSDVDAEYAISEPLPDKYERTFPDTGLQSEADLLATIQALEARVAQLEAKQQSGDDGVSSKGSPGLPAILGLLALVFLAARRR